MSCGIEIRNIAKQMDKQKKKVTFVAEHFMESLYLCVNYRLKKYCEMSHSLYSAGMVHYVCFDFRNQKERHSPNNKKMNTKSLKIRVREVRSLKNRVNIIEKYFEEDIHGEYNRLTYTFTAFLFNFLRNSTVVGCFLEQLYL